jgi:hypothetical protein
MRYYPITENYSKEEYFNTPVKYWVLKTIWEKHDKKIPRLSVEVECEGGKRWPEFEAYKSFETEKEVMEFARINKITDIILDENKVIIPRPMKGKRDNY